MSNRILNSDLILGRPKNAHARFSSATTRAIRTKHAQRVNREPGGVWRGAYCHALQALRGCIREYRRRHHISSLVAAGGEIHPLCLRQWRTGNLRQDWLKEQQDAVDCALRALRQLRELAAGNNFRLP